MSIFFLIGRNTEPPLSCDSENVIALWTFYSKKNLWNVRLSFNFSEFFLHIIYCSFFLFTIRIYYAV